ncbi:hypothetical protein A2635_03950 [Candidatus Peribacteria bacterium RIFCSPHIGHO2_01_FULL_51_9]|nr:MAG: hypothetical protein A2635_03950 [Candidatus Peribacteria bacterium RIFCSPHIGHO2_01_FULL_51_9]
MRALIVIGVLMAFVLLSFVTASGDSALSALIRNLQENPITLKVEFGRMEETQDLKEDQSQSSSHATE